MKNQSVALAGAIVWITYAACAQSAPASEKTAGEAMKNVQVLKDVPVSEWDATMAFMGTALGVSCAHCHKGPLESDELKAKQTARNMIQMTRELNAKSFDGRAVITCQTCHQGSVRPNGTPTLWNKTPEEVAAIRKARQPAATASQTPPAAQSLPDVREVLERYRKAVGSDHVKSVRMKALLTPDLGDARDIQIDVGLPDKFELRLTVAGGEVRQIVNGKRGWVVAQGKSTEMTDSNMTAAGRFLSVFQPVKFADEAAPRKVTGIEKIGDRTYAVVESTSARMLERLYFDTDSGLLYKAHQETISPLGRYPAETVFEDYRDLGGVKLPFLIKSIGSSDRSVVKFSEIQTDVSLEAGLFLPPPAAAEKK